MWFKLFSFLIVDYFLDCFTFIVKLKKKKAQEFIFRGPLRDTLVIPAVWGTACSRAGFQQLRLHLYTLLLIMAPRSCLCQDPPQPSGFHSCHSYQFASFIFSLHLLLNLDLTEKLMKMNVNNKWGECLSPSGILRWNISWSQASECISQTVASPGSVLLKESRFLSLCLLQYAVKWI